MFNTSKQERKIPTFTSRADAFQYMFGELYQNGADPLSAADRANDFANVVAENLCLPKEPEKPKTAVEQGISILKQVTVIKREYPDVWDLLVGALGGVIGSIAGVKATEELEEPTAAPLDFDTMQGA